MEIVNIDSSFQNALIKYFDCRFAELAKPRVALIISLVCILSALGLSGYYMTGAVYQKSTRKCGYGTGNRGAVS